MNHDYLLSYEGSRGTLFAVRGNYTLSEPRPMTAADIPEIHKQIEKNCNLDPGTAFITMWVKL